MMLPLAIVAQLAGSCAPEVAPGTLAAIAATESGFDPLAVYDNTTAQSWRPQSRADATLLARTLIGAGHAVDLGLMQIDSANLARLHLAVSQSFDACASLFAGARVLAADYRPNGVGSGGKAHAAQQAALRVALSRYNTGSPDAGFRNGYVRRVVDAAVRVVPEIDPGAVLSGEPATPTDPPLRTNWNVFGAGTSQKHGDTASWDIFPQSVGPDRLQLPPSATGADGSGLSPAGSTVGGSTHD
jgi:type IV secretion system protein VirB1